MNDKLLQEAIVNYIITKGSGMTTTCNYTFSFAEIAEHFEISVSKVDEWSDDIIEQLYEMPQIMDQDGALISTETNGEKYFDVMFYGNFCNVEIDD